MQPQALTLTSALTLGLRWAPSREERVWGEGWSLEKTNSSLWDILTLGYIWAKLCNLFCSSVLSSAKWV